MRTGHTTVMAALLPVLMACAWAATPPGQAGVDALAHWQVDSARQAAVNADRVVKVEVLSLLEAGTARNEASANPLEVRRLTASCRVISEIKERCPQIIRVEFQYPAESDIQSNPSLAQAFTSLRVGEVALVFLKDIGMDFRLNRLDGKVRIAPSRIQHDMVDSPEERLLSEFVGSAQDGDPMVRLQAVEELGYVGDAILRQMAAGEYRYSSEAADRCIMLDKKLDAAREVLAELRKSTDLVLRCAAIISSFQVDATPGDATAVEVLLADPTALSPAESTAQYGTVGFSVQAMQARLLDVMDATTRRLLLNMAERDVIRRRDGKPYRGIRGFWYPEFCAAALACESVRDSAAMRRSLANILWVRADVASVPEMIALLDDPDILVRSAVVAGLIKTIASPYSNPLEVHSPWMSSVDAMDVEVRDREIDPAEAMRDYQQKEQEYLTYWKTWWSENKGDFDAADLKRMKEEEMAKPDTW